MVKPFHGKITNGLTYCSFVICTFLVSGVAYFAFCFRFVLCVRFYMPFVCLPHAIYFVFFPFFFFSCLFFFCIYTFFTISFFRSFCLCVCLFVFVSQCSNLIPRYNISVGFFFYRCGFCKKFQVSFFYWFSFSYSCTYLFQKAFPTCFLSQC